MSEQMPNVSGDEGMDLPGGGAATLAELVSIPAKNDVIDGALRLVVELAEATVQGANGVSVSLERHGKLRTVAATNDTVLQMDHHQYESGEGPCVAAAAEGDTFLIDSLAEEARWPTFVPEATQQGIKSILSTPLIPGDRPIGALNIYSDAERAFGASQQAIAQLFATQASGILADAGLDADRTALLADALRSREIIAVAQGVVMARTGISQHEAARALREEAHRTGMTMRQHAIAVVQSTQGRRPASDG